MADVIRKGVKHGILEAKGTSPAGAPCRICDPRSILMAMKAHRDWAEETKGITDCPVWAVMLCVVRNGTSTMSTT